MDKSAKNYHIKTDGCLPEIVVKNQLRTYITRRFGGGSFRIYMKDEEYDERFKIQEIRVADYETYIIPRIPSEQYLCYEDEEGNEIKIRNCPRKNV